MLNNLELKLFQYKKFILSSNRFNSIQYIRALACISVVIFHIEEYINLSTPLEINHNFFTWGGIGVQIFFVLSGFIIPFSIYRKERKPFYFIYSRFIRIYPTYLFTLFFYLILVFCINNYLSISTTQQLEFQKIFFSLLLNLGKSTNGYIQVAWTLFYEFCFYLIFTLLVKDFRKKCNSELFYVLTIFLQVCFLLSNNFYLFSFLSGISIFLIIINPANLKLKNPLYLFLFLIFILSFLFDVKSFIASGVLLIALLTEYLNKNLYSNTLINKIGDFSYSIYIIQEIIISSSIKISSYSYKFFNLNNDLIFYIFNLCSISYLVIIAGFILGKLIEKPALNILMKKS